MAAATEGGGADGSGGPGGGKAGKKPRPPPPAPPPAVATAGLLVRAAASRVLGLRPGRGGWELQPLWLTEPGHGKITISLEGSSRLPFPRESQHEALLDAVEAEAATLAAADAPLSVVELARAEAEATYGEAVAAAVADPLRLAWLPGAALLELPPGWRLCERAGGCGRLRFARGAEGGKKAETAILSRKKQLTVRFAVELEADAAREDLRGQPPELAEVRATDNGEVRVQVRGVDFEAADGTGALAGAAGVPASAGGKKDVEAAEEKEEEMYVNIDVVTGKIDYSRLIKDFGSTPISPALMQRIERNTVGNGRVPHLHRWLRRGIFFSHRDLEALLQCHEDGKPFYLYTGRGPSSAAMHLGHLLPFMMTKWLQDAFGVPLVIQMTEDEKFLWKGKYEEQTGDNLMYYRGLTHENAKDIIACGFDKDKTFIFPDLDYVGHMYPNIVRIWKAITYNTARSAMGFVGESNIGQSAFPAVQAAPSFPSSFPVPLKGDDKMACLIPCAIDQDPYFRLTRDIAHKLVPKDHPLGGKPALLHSKFFPPLTGASGKMSASDENSAIYLTDTPEQIETKILRYAFSGGRDTAKEQREKGADLEKDVPYQWLRFFLEDDDELERIGREYGSGQGEHWNTGSVKTRLIAELQAIVAQHQAARRRISDAEVRSWMEVRELKF